ncbi:MAG TPA: 30S ribosomal protein S8 [Verrucomicrobiota bacterium]|nr:30S ribosomal protein S8 [Verrucomicrobiota bacterium]
MSSDPIADMLTRVRNAARAQLPHVVIPHSRLKEGIAHILKREGYVTEAAVEGTARKSLRLTLKYQGRRPVIEGIRRLSSPGRRLFVPAGKIPRVRGGLGVVILSTSSGVMTGDDARKQNVGGELLCSIW